MTGLQWVDAIVDRYGEPHKKIGKLNDLAWDLRHTNLPDALALSYRTHELLITHPLPSEQLRCWALLAELQLRQGSYQQAILVGNAAMTIVEKDALVKEHPHLLATLGTTHLAIGNYAEAIGNYQQQQQVSRQLEDPANEADALSNISLVHLELGNPHLAHQSFMAALAIYEAAKNHYGQAVVMNNLAMNFQAMGKLSDALLMAQRALQLSKELNARTLQTYILDTIALIYIDLGYHTQALDHCHQGLDLAFKINSLPNIGAFLFRIGQCYSTQSHQELLAVTYLEDALQRFTELNQPKDLFHCHQLLALMYEKQQDSTRALHHFKLFYEIKDAIYNQKRFRAIEDLANQEIHTLRQRVDEFQLALENVKQQTGIVPMCAKCKNIRDEQGIWHKVETFIQRYTNASITHGICPDCKAELYPFLKKGSS